MNWEKMENGSTLLAPKVRHINEKNLRFPKGVMDTTYNIPIKKIDIPFLYILRKGLDKQLKRKNKNQYIPCIKFVCSHVA